MFEKMTVEECLRELQVKKSFLTEEEAKRRLVVYGLNELADKKRPTWLGRLLAQFMDPLIYVLFAAGIISVFLGESGDALIIVAVVLLNAIVGLIQEGKAEKALDALKNMTRLKALVRRDGTVQEIDARRLVPGDVVLLDAGRQVPADLRLLNASNLRIEEAALTGESAPVRKDAFFVAKDPLPVGDRKNMAFMSTNVTAGRGEGLVVATGMETEIGKIAKLIHEAPEEATPLQKRLGDLGELLSVLAILLCMALFGLAVLQERDIGEMFLTAISLAVAAVPEGLPAVVTIVLALSVSRMVKAGTIVRRLPSVETLGAVNVVCSDKTGTLTKNKMTVECFTSAAAVLGRKEESEELYRAFLLCNDGKLPDMGDPTELALLAYGALQGRDAALYNKKFLRVGELPFDSERKRMTTFHRGEGGIRSYTKGAPDVILKRCTHYQAGGEKLPLGPSEKRRIEGFIADLSKRALRVLGAAVSDGENRQETGLTFLGLAAMMDPPREEVPAAVKLFGDANVRTVMITGDHKDTAFAIAKKLSIASHTSQCMSGEEIDQADEETFKERVQTVNVFARVSSDHKVRIVKMLKSLGNIVAMTGDGVNDAPSLKAADVGIAMGRCGTDVAKQAADIVLTDDNFATIERAIEEGRGIYENIKKSVIFLLSSNFGEIMTMFTAVACMLPSPLKPSHILWINLITDSLPALALGTDRNDGKALMKEPPRKSTESLFAHGGLSCTCFYGLLIAIASLTAFLSLPLRLLGAAEMEITIETIGAVLKEPGVLAHSQTYAFTVLGLSQLFHAVGMRDVEKSVFRMNHLENKLMAAAVILGVLLQVAVTEIPALVTVFQTVKLTGAEWRELLILSSAPMIAHELLLLLHKLKKSKKNQDAAG